jgi:hypothetical protein
MFSQCLCTTLTQCKHNITSIPARKKKRNFSFGNILTFIPVDQMLLNVIPSNLSVRSEAFVTIWSTLTAYDTVMYIDVSLASRVLQHHICLVRLLIVMEIDGPMQSEHDYCSDCIGAVATSHYPETWIPWFNGISFRLMSENHRKIS